MKDKTIMLTFKDRFLIKKIDTIYHLYNLVNNMKYNTYDNINDLFKYLKRNDNECYKKLKTYLKVNKLSGGSDPSIVPEISSNPEVNKDNIKKSNYDELKTYIEENKDKITLWSNVLHLNSIIGSISKEEFLERISAEIKSIYPDWVYTSSYLLKQLNKGIDHKMKEEKGVLNENYYKLIKKYFDNNENLDKIIQNLEKINTINSEYTDDTVKDVNKTIMIASINITNEDLDEDLVKNYIIKVINEGFESVSDEKVDETTKGINVEISKEPTIIKIKITFNKNTDLEKSINDKLEEKLKSFKNGVFKNLIINQIDSDRFDELISENKELIESYIKKIKDEKDLIKDIMFLKYFYDDWKTNLLLNNQTNDHIKYYIQMHEICNISFDLFKEIEYIPVNIENKTFWDTESVEIDNIIKNISKQFYMRTRAASVNLSEPTIKHITVILKHKIEKVFRNFSFSKEYDLEYLSDENSVLRNLNKEIIDMIHKNEDMITLENFGDFNSIKNKYNGLFKKDDKESSMFSSSTTEEEKVKENKEKANYINNAVKYSLLCTYLAVNIESIKYIFQNQIILQTLLEKIKDGESVSTTTEKYLQSICEQYYLAIEPGQLDKKYYKEFNVNILNPLHKLDIKSIQLESTDTDTFIEKGLNNENSKQKYIRQLEDLDIIIFEKNILGQTKDIFINNVIFFYETREDEIKFEIDKDKSELFDIFKQKIRKALRKYYQDLLKNKFSDLEGELEQKLEEFDIDIEDEELKEDKVLYNKYLEEKNYFEKKKFDEFTIFHKRFMKHLKFINDDKYFEYIINKYIINQKRLPFDFNKTYKEVKNEYDNKIKDLHKLFSDGFLNKSIMQVGGTFEETTTSLKGKEGKSDEENNTSGNTLDKFIGMIEKHIDNESPAIDSVLNKLQLMYYLHNKEYLNLIKKYSDVTDAYNKLVELEEVNNLPKTSKPVILKLIDNLFLNNMINDKTLIDDDSKVDDLSKYNNEYDEETTITSDKKKSKDKKITDFIWNTETGKKLNVAAVDSEFYSVKR